MSLKEYNHRFNYWRLTRKKLRGEEHRKKAIESYIRKCIRQGDKEIKESFKYGRTRVSINMEPNYKGYWFTDEEEQYILDSVYNHYKAQGYWNVTKNVSLWNTRSTRLKLK